MEQKRDLDKGQAAIVCGHIANKRFPILSAFRTAPGFEEDSGWQFFCGTVHDEDPDEAEIWSVEEVLEHEPSLRPLIHLASDVQLTRDSLEDEWVVRTALR